MKKLLIACAAFVFATTVANAQEANSAETNKELKAKLKKVKEQNLNSSFTEAGLSEEQIKEAKAVLDDAKEKSNKLKEDNSMAEEDKKAKKEAINQEKNGKLKEIMKDKYKAWGEIRKTQKAQEEEMAAKIAQ